MIKLDVIETEPTLKELTVDWARLSDAATPMQTPEWMLTWWRAHAGPQDRLCVLAIRNHADELIGLAPWYRHTTIALGTTIRFLGSGRACSDYQTLLCCPGSEEAVVRAVAQWLSRTDCRTDSEVAVPATKWHLLDFDGVSDSDVVMKTFVNTMAERGHVTHLRPAESTWQLDLTGGWDGFLSRQSKTQRTQARNFVNRFDKSSDLRLRIASQSGPQVESMIAALMNLHQERWRAVGVEGSFTDARMRSFFENAMREMVAGGSAEILSLERNGRPIVVQSWLLQNGWMYLYQCGRDPAEDGNRVGSIANAVAIRWACDQEFRAIDFLRGDEAYKSQLRAAPVRNHRLRIVARANLPELRHRLWLACRDVKSRWQELRKPTAMTAPEEEPSKTHESSVACAGRFPPFTNSMAAGSACPIHTLDTSK